MRLLPAMPAERFPRPRSLGAGWVVAIALLVAVPTGVAGARGAVATLARNRCGAGDDPTCVTTADGGRPATTALPPSGGWTQLQILGPSARSQPAIAYDPSIQAVVMFGGYSSGFGAIGDTWLFANNAWTPISASLSVSPPARWGASMVWDAAAGNLVMFGGRTLTGFFNDTWTFSGTAWSNVTRPLAPPARSLFEMAYDPVSGQVLVDGGARLNFSTGVWGTIDDTWAYAGGTWTNVSQPPPGGALDRAAGQAAFDPWSNSVVFVGGGSTSNWTLGCTPIDPIQAYAGGRWTESPSSVGPPGVSQEMMTYDAAGDYLLLFGGYGQTGSGTPPTCIQLGATWIRWQGNWTNISGELAVAPSARYLSGIAFDPVLNEVLLFGGNGEGAYLGDTWIFAAAPLVSNASSSPPGVPLAYLLVALVVVGAVAGLAGFAVGRRGRRTPPPPR